MIEGLTDSRAIARELAKQAQRRVSG